MRFPSKFWKESIGNDEMMIVGILGIVGKVRIGRRNERKGWRLREGYMYNTSKGNIN